MLDLFSIFTKGGIVLWCFQQGSTLSLTPAVNALIKTVILQERPGSLYNHGNLTMCFKMDNQYELIFVAAYQSIVTLSYVDKLIDQVSLAFRDKYKNELVSGPLRMVNFSQDFHKIHRAIEEEASIQARQPKKMKTFSESYKFEKNCSLVVSQVGVASSKEEATEVSSDDAKMPAKSSPRNNFLKKLGTRDRGSRSEKKTGVKKSGPVVPAKRSKEARVWEGGNQNKDPKSLNYSADNGGEDGSGTSNGVNGTGLGVDYSGEDDGGNMKELQPLEVSPSTSSSAQSSSAGGSGSGLMSFFKSLTTGKKVTREAMAPVLEKLQEHLIKKNVAVEIADKLCESVAVKLNGKVISNFTGLQSTVRSSMEESLVQILSPKVRIDVLHDVKKSSDRGVPYVITFCGVNGVGKSTNLAKVANWLMRNEYRVLIAACDTFRSGAVEQLRTHAQHLSALNPSREEGGPSNVMLYDRGYKKDPSGVAMEAIHFATQQKYDVVLVDTAGRMQDNEPLMRALAKLIRVNSPDLVLFVGEALVGNEAVDQLVKFNRALVDHSEEGNTRTIDGIVLTKFDTIDDKVGAAISMTYTTGQPIVFVGTGQRYTDIKSLNVQAVVTALLK